VTYTLDSRIQDWLFVVVIPIMALGTGFGIVSIRLHDSTQSERGPARGLS